MTAEISKSGVNHKFLKIRMTKMRNSIDNNMFPKIDYKTPVQNNEDYSPY